MAFDDFTERAIDLTLEHPENQAILRAEHLNGLARRDAEFYMPLVRSLPKTKPIVDKVRSTTDPIQRLHNLETVVSQIDREGIEDIKREIGFDGYAEPGSEPQSEDRAWAHEFLRTTLSPVLRIADIAPTALEAARGMYASTVAAAHIVAYEQNRDPLVGFADRSFADEVHRRVFPTREEAEGWSATSAELIRLDSEITPLNANLSVRFGTEADAKTQENAAVYGDQSVVETFIEHLQAYDAREFDRIYGSDKNLSSSTPLIRENPNY